MPAELRHPVPKRRKSAHTYFVGRRKSWIAELYAVALTTHFARSVLAALPKHSVVLGSDALGRWALLASRSEKPTSREPEMHRSWLARLHGNLFGGSHA